MYASVVVGCRFAAATAAASGDDDDDVAALFVPFIALVFVLLRTSKRSDVDSVNSSKDIFFPFAAVCFLSGFTGFNVRFEILQIRLASFCILASWDRQTLAQRVANPASTPFQAKWNHTQQPRASYHL